MTYNLTEKQIEDILREGKFDKEKYAYYLSLSDFIVGDSVNEYEMRHMMPLIKNKNELYKKVADNADNANPFDDYTYESICDDLNYLIETTLKDIEKLTEEGEII